MTSPVYQLREMKKSKHLSQPFSHWYQAASEGKHYYLKGLDPEECAWDMRSIEAQWVIPGASVI